MALFRQIVHNKYLIYNSLFLHLPQEDTAYTAIYIPLLQKLASEGLAQAQEPKQIIEDFFEKHTPLQSPEERLNLLFRMVQFIERQVLLFDCVEDAAFPSFNKQALGEMLDPKDARHETLKAHLQQFSTRLVFTAHPTQFYSEDVQRIMHELRKAIQADQVAEVDRLLQQLSYTPFVKREPPTPYDEALNIIHYLRYVYYEALGRLYHRLQQRFGLSPDFNPSLIELGFWPGGDRDGNPFVKADTTLKVALQLRNTVMKCYYNHLKVLRRKLSFRTVTPILDTLQKQLYAQIFQDSIELTDQEILTALYTVRDKVKADYKGLYLAEVEDFIGRVHLFGSHFAALDIRQDSSKHREAMRQIFRRVWGLDYEALDAPTRRYYLLEQPLEAPLNPADYAEDETTADTLANIAQIRQIQQYNGQRGLHRYIISNTESAWEILELYALFRFVGYAPEDIHMDLVPLFETMQGMAASADIMRQLYQEPIYRAHLARRGDSQTIMLGFSDGTKDGGYLKANWSIYRCKEDLTALSREQGLQVLFFDGRGGPPARGGGKSHRFYAAQGEEIAGDKIQLTIQGQTITSVYGTHEHASYNVEQLILAGARTLRPRQSLAPEHRVLLADLAERSYDKYLQLKQDPLFIRYLEEMTTLKYYGQTNIGSRPSKRRADRPLQLEDLRAIPFVGAWSLARQNVPGYYGLGSALEAYAAQPELIEGLYRDSALFRSLIQNSIMSMKKTYFPLTAYMQRDPIYGAFWQDLRQEYLLAKKWALRLTGDERLMAHEPETRLSINLREQIVLPLLCIQQYALQQIQAEHPDKALFEKLLIRTLFGNINAGRNSA